MQIGLLFVATTPVMENRTGQTLNEKSKKAETEDDRYDLQAWVGYQSCADRVPPSESRQSRPADRAPTMMTFRIRGVHDAPDKPLVSE